MENPALAGRCLTTPVLFFTLADGNHLQSERVLAELRRTLQEKHPNVPRPGCATFSAREKVQEYFLEHGVNPYCTVGLFDVAYCSGKFFFPLVRGKKTKGVTVPDWCPAQWGIAINTRLRDRGVRSAAYQLTADFMKRFPTQEEFGKNKLPWGNPPTATRSGKKRRESRNKKRTERVPLFVQV